jgi:alcohol dehydrogenase class IV
MEQNINLELRKFVSPEIVFGNDSRFLTSRYARNFAAKKAFIVTDPGLIKAGWVDQIKESFISEGIEYTVYSNVSVNPDAEEVMEGAKIYKEEECNIIMAIGGGSPMDCAKGIGIVSSNDRDIREFEGVDKVPIPAPPLICIPTTAGSSADVSQFAIISDRNEKTKMAIISKTLVPDVALIDPTTTLTMNLELTASTAFDTFCHAMEAMVSNANSPITDLHALEAIKIVSRYILLVLENPDNISIRNKMMLSSLHAGLAFSNASLGLVHAMAHSLGGLLDLPHGDCNAILLDHVVRYNFSSEIERYTMIGNAMGLKLDNSYRDLEIILNKIIELKQKTGMNMGLKSVGVTEENIPLLSDRTLQDPCVVTNPKMPTRIEVEEIFRNAF